MSTTEDFEAQEGGATGRDVCPTDSKSQIPLSQPTQTKGNIELAIAEYELERMRLQLEHERKEAEIEIELKFLLERKKLLWLMNLMEPSQLLGVSSNSSHLRQDSVAFDLSRFLLKKDLLMQRLTVFDEKPEMFSAWKACFKCVVAELSMTASEELDLLVRWLGPESSKHAKTVRVSNATDPTWGVTEVWERLEERYGAPEIVEALITQKLTNFAKLGNRDNKRLYDLVDIMLEIQSLMDNPRYSLLFSYYNTSSGILPIIQKLPFNLQEKWALRASNYKRQHGIPFPPFSYFLDFVKEFARIRNDPGFSFLYEPSSTRPVARNIGTSSQRIVTRKHDVTTDTNPGVQQRLADKSEKCPLHGTPHSLNKCREFSTWDFNKRKDFLRSKGVCYKCCVSNKHLSKDCTNSEPCSVCKSVRHATAMHIDRPTSVKVEDTLPTCTQSLVSSQGERSNYGGEPSDSSGIVNKCTHLCGSRYGSRSCSKTVLVQVYPEFKPEKAVTIYAILDEQSNKSLAHAERFDELEINSPSINFRMLSCSGPTEMAGRHATNLIVRSVDGAVEHMLPSLKPNTKIQLLIGRDVGEVHHVKQQIIGPRGSPFAQQLSLGWMIVGDVCIGKWHREQTVNVLKTNLISNERASLFTPCEARISVQEVTPDFDFGQSIFVRTPEDERTGTSYEDREFLKIMDAQVTKDTSGVWMAPLPFKTPRPRLPNNRPQALHRAKLLESSLRKNPTKLEHFIIFMDKVLSSGAAEQAPEIIDEDKERWYLPLFGVYHPKKPTQLRGVFDSSVMYEGLSLNNVLLTGPNLTNSLLGVLLRFRKDECAFTADVEQMFCRFYVNPKHRDFLRFFWFKDLKDFDINADSLPLQHSLGLTWNINIDKFVFDTPSMERPFTRRGLLSAISSVFDPIGFVAPLTVSGKILLRTACPDGVTWDETLPHVNVDLWTAWCDNLQKLDGYEIPRMFVPLSLSLPKDCSIIIYSDASESAVAAAAYVVVTDSSGQEEMGFVLGKAKLAPPSGTSIPRLELCAAVLATEIGQIVAEHLDIVPTSIKYFTDSKVVLGYIRNKKRRFYTYVCNRVAKIHHISSPEQWNYVPSDKNPVDAATRDSSTDMLPALKKWITGPIYLLGEKDRDHESEDFPLLNPECDCEVRPVLSKKTALSLPDVLITECFNKFSTWNGLVQAVAILQHIAHTFHKENNNQCKGWHICKEAKTLDARKRAEHFILRLIQEQSFDREVKCLGQDSDIPRDSHIISLSPFMDDNSLLRVGSRLNYVKDKLGLSSVNPIIIPKGHVALLLARHFHERNYHQGRKFTESQLRSNGYWVLGAKRLVTSLISKCLLCRKIRGKVQEPKMANLPIDRLTPGPPFSAVGVDMFGPWQVTTRRTRGGAAHSKRWAIVFTCLTSRAIHIEVVEDMSSSSFINALRRFTSIRGPVNVYRSDRGTNFVGAVDQLGIDSINVEDDTICHHLRDSG